MRKYLPKLFFVFLALAFFITSVFPTQVFAQRGDPRLTQPVPPPRSQDTPIPGGPTNIPDAPGPQPIADDTWVQDKEVTFTGKNAARAGLLLNWALSDYAWSHVKNKKKNPLEDFWAEIRNVVLALLVLFIIVTAFILITTRGRSITAKRFIPRFIAVVLLILFSFALIQLMYQATDVIQGYFLKSKPNSFCPPKCISQQDLLFVGWEYKPFTGVRRYGEQFEESAFISLLLVKLTALTYYVMVGVLVIRKIILWFFIIISPIFPLLLLYYPVRNTAKIWLGEFFRWLMYAPLFAIFLGGLVSLWQSNIPMDFDFSKVHKVKQIIFPTAINIMIGGPQQQVNFTNSINLADTFALYIVALLMLWGVIIVPWILLQIFLDYAFSYNYSENPVFRQFMGFMGNKPPPTAPSPPPSSSGIARALPFKDFIMPQMPKGAGIAMQIPRDTRMQQPVRVPLQINKQAQQDILKLTNLSVPTMRDIGRFETSILSRDIQKQADMNRMRQSLQQISTTRVDVREQLQKASQQGNAMASSVLQAANSITRIATVPTAVTTQQVSNIIQYLAKPETVSNPSQRQQVITLKDTLTRQSKAGNQLAVVVINATKGLPSETQSQRVAEKLKEAKAKGDPLAQAIAGLGGPSVPSGLPNVNRIQQVSLDDYEAVRKMWTENYNNLDVPRSITGAQDRKSWVKEDIKQISETINLLSSTDPRQVEEGMQQVSNILPFLLMGGFSQSEIIAYLRAKQEAGKSVLTELEKTQQEEETMVEREQKTTQKEAHMQEQVERPLEENEFVAKTDQQATSTDQPPEEEKKKET
ncbi:MAG: hypothetical protein HY431_01805 [Candidatus Levybacteria bacterium]|nr:hypothetical protein [Candidatus Levybacteria bacterium]